MEFKSLTFPNAILVGAQKAGTTSFFDWMSQHPQICAPYVAKEFHFFCHDRRNAGGSTALESLYSDCKGAVVGLQGGVNHLYCSEQGAKRIFEYRSDMKLIAILRDPVYRAYSAYNYFRKLGQETASSFEEAVELEGGRLEQSLDFDERCRCSYLDHGFYGKQLQIYFRFFPRRQVHIILFEDLCEEPREVIRSAFAFLKVDPDFRPSTWVQNRTGVARFELVNRLVFNKSFVSNTVRGIPGIRRALPLAVRARILDSIRDWNTKSATIPPLQADTVSALRGIFADDTRLLCELLDRDLSDWKTFPAA